MAPRTKTAVASDVMEAERPTSRETSREPARPVAREAVRSDPNVLEFITAEGVRVTRARMGHNRGPNEEHNVPRHLWPKGVIYNWKNTSIYGEEQRESMLSLKRNGWVEVPPSRHPDYPTHRPGQVLMELSEEWAKMADAEDSYRAEAQRKGAASLDLPSGYTTDTPAVRQNTFVRRQWEPAPSELKPALKIDMGDE